METPQAAALVRIMFAREKGLKQSRSVLMVLWVCDALPSLAFAHGRVLRQSPVAQGQGSRICSAITRASGRAVGRKHELRSVTNAAFLAPERRVRLTCSTGLHASALP